MLFREGTGEKVGTHQDYEAAEGCIGDVRDGDFELQGCMSVLGRLGRAWGEKERGNGRRRTGSNLMAVVAESRASGRVCDVYGRSPAPCDGELRRNTQVRSWQESFRTWS